MNQQIPSSELMARARHAAARCIAVGISGSALDTIQAEFQAIAREIAPWNLSGEEIVRLFLRPMQESLSQLLPTTEARRLYLTFFDSLWNRSWSDSIRHRKPTVKPLQSSVVPDWYDRHLAEIFRSGEPVTPSSRDPL